MAGIFNRPETPGFKLWIKAIIVSVFLPVRTSSPAYQPGIQYKMRNEV